MREVTDPYLTTKEVARLLHTTPERIRRWCKAGELPASRIGRIYLIRRSVLDAWLDSQRGAKPNG